MTAIEQAIYSSAIQGTPKNPKGLPASLALLLLAQSKHESDNYSSNIFREGNNAFGYAWVPGSTWQIGPGRVADNGQAAARYQDVQDSTREIVDWIYRRVKEGEFPVNLGSVSSPEQYARLLKDAGYYGDTYTHYSQGLRNWFETVKQYAPAAGGVALGLLIAAGLVWYYRKKIFSK